MHDIPSAGQHGDLLAAILAAAVLLALIPLIFNDTLTTIGDPVSLAIHAHQLARSDTLPSSHIPSFRGLPRPPSGRLAFGVHELYPLRIFTIRDTISGDVLSRTVFPGELEDTEGSVLRDSLEVRFLSSGRRLTAMTGEEGSSSWPRELFSVLTGR